METNTLIYVIIPVYNVEKYLERCVESVLGQTYNNFCLILIDDGSPDHSPKICDDYAKKDSRIKVIHQNNGGLSAARNRGLDWIKEKKEGEWITFIDSDDWIHPKYLETLFGIVNEYNCKVSICGNEITDGSNFSVIHEFSIEKYTPEQFYITKHDKAITAWGKLYHRSCFENLRYPVGKIHEDEYTTHLTIFSTDVIVYTPAKLYYYYQNNAGITKSSWNPSRLDAVDGIKSQIVFFHKEGYQKAYVFAIKKLFDYLYYTYDRLYTEGTHKKERQYIKKELRDAFRKYKEIYLINDHPWVYAVAFPIAHRFRRRVPWLNYATDKSLSK